MWFVCVASSASAHPGGTDRFGCHVDSSTGLRHCHGTGGGEGGNFVPAAEAAIEVGGSYSVNDHSKLTYHGSFHLQHDASMVFLVGFGGAEKPWGGPSMWSLYYDINIGAALLSQESVYFAARAAGGIRADLFEFQAQRHAVYLKAGAFVDLIADGVDAETLGASLTLGLAL